MISFYQPLKNIFYCTCSFTTKEENWNMIFVNYSLLAEERASNWKSERQHAIYLTATQNSVSSPLKWEGSKKQQTKT